MSKSLHKKTIVLFIIAIVFVVIDRFLKALSLAGLYDQKILLLGDFLSLKFEPNRFIAFSLPFGGSGLPFFIASIILVLICYLVHSEIREKNNHRTIFLFLIILGASSNLIDRLLYGFVIDYIYLKYFTIFNIADMMIVLGTIGLFFINKKAPV